MTVTTKHFSSDDVPAVAPAQEPNMGWTEALGEHAAFPKGNGPPGLSSVFALGKEWPVGNLQNRVRAWMEKWVRGNAEKALFEMSLTMHPDDHRNYQAAYVADRSAGRYNWEEDTSHHEAGAAIRAALADIPGTNYIFYLLLRVCDENMTLQLARKINRANPKQVGIAIGWALGNWESPPPQPAVGTERKETKEESRQKPATLNGP